MVTPNQVTAAYKANLESMLDYTAKAFEGVEKLADLNMQVAKASFSESLDNTKKALSAKDAQELLSMQASLVQPLAQKMLNYSRYLYEIAANVQTELNKVNEKNFSSGTNSVETSLEGFSKDSQAFAESAASMVRTAVGSAYESVNKATKQAMDLVEGGLQTATTPKAAKK